MNHNPAQESLVVIDVGRHDHAVWTQTPEVIPDDPPCAPLSPTPSVALEAMPDIMTAYADYVGDGLRTIDEANVARGVNEALSDME